MSLLRGSALPSFFWLGARSLPASSQVTPSPTCRAYPRFRLPPAYNPGLPLSFAKWVHVKGHAVVAWPNKSGAPNFSKSRQNPSVFTARAAPPESNQTGTPTIFVSPSRKLRLQARHEIETTTSPALQILLDALRANRSASG
jgi:hypothetical protein